MKLYIAAPVAAAAIADELAGAVGRMGHIVVSGWHGLLAADPLPIDPKGDVERAAILSLNLTDMAKAQGLIALTYFHDMVGRGTYGEIAWALAAGKPVAWVQDGWRGRSIFDAHSLVQRFQSSQLVPSPAVALADWARLHEPEEKAPGLVCSLRDHFLRIGEE